MYSRPISRMTAIGLPFEIGTAVSPTFDAPGIDRSNGAWFFQILFYALFSLSPPNGRSASHSQEGEKRSHYYPRCDDFVTARINRLSE